MDGEPVHYLRDSISHRQRLSRLRRVPSRSLSRERIERLVKFVARPRRNSRLRSSRVRSGRYPSAILNSCRLNLSLMWPHSRILEFSLLLICCSSGMLGQVLVAEPDVVLTLDQAIQRAQGNETAYANAVAESRIANLDRSIARDSLLPTLTFHNQGLYTQPNGSVNQAGPGTGSQPSPRFIANNAVREYASQGMVNETVGLAGVAGIRRADAAAAQAAAELEVARRGLIAAVTGLYYGLAAADNKLEAAQRAHDEAADFTKLTGQREQAREAAHADVVKAQLEQQQRERELSDAKL